MQKIIWGNTVSVSILCFCCTICELQVLAERHYPIRPAFNETRSGVCLDVDGVTFTPEELVAMVLTHARDISALYGDMSDSGMVRDCVLTVPSFYTVHERRALLDAAELADLNVLALLDETTAAALHYGMDRVEKEPSRVLFYNMGASALQVEVVEFFSYEHKESKYAKGKTVGAFEVKGKAWDATLGGDLFDARIVDYMADKFNEEWNKKRGDGETKDVRVNQRAMTKLKIQANKVKHVLSANNDIPVFIEALHDDTNLKLTVTRAEFEQVVHDLMLRIAVPIRGAVAAANMTMDDIDAVELIGGGMRVPLVQEEIQKVLGENLVLGLHINSDESMALGAAFHGANISTAFRVRHVGMTDVNPFPVAIALNHLDDPTAIPEGEETPWQKRATLFKSFGKVGIKKTIAFSQEEDVHCELSYDESDILPKGTQ
jgi:hypoxia up-regulated 1